MRTDEWLWENVVLEIYTQMYNESEPSIDFKRLYNEAIDRKYKYITDLFGKEHRKLFPQWFMRFYLSGERQQEIIDEFKVKYKLTKREVDKVTFNVYLEISPCSVRESQTINTT